MEKSVMTRAAIGAILIGTGLALMLSASRKLPCPDCVEKHEPVAEPVLDEATE